MHQTTPCNTEDVAWFIRIAAVYDQETVSMSKCTERARGAVENELVEGSRREELQRLEKLEGRREWELD